MLKSIQLLAMYISFSILFLLKHRDGGQNSTEAILLTDILMCNSSADGSFLNTLAGCNLTTSQCSPNNTIRLTCNCTGYECSDGHCGIECDGTADCSDGLDDDDIVCERCTYLCVDGECVNGTMCDGMVDCMDESDEIPRLCLNCSSIDDMVACDDGSCVEGELCDGTEDCEDGSDEVACGK